jgi:general secretion pathway protein D
MRHFLRTPLFVSLALMPFSPILSQSHAQDEPLPAMEESPAPAVETNGGAPAPVASETAGSAAAKAAQFEMVRRQELVFASNQAVSDGDKLRLGGDLDRAAERYQYALQYLSPAGPTASAYQRAAFGMAQVRYMQAQKKTAAGEHAQAVQLLEESVRLQPQNATYQKALAQAREAAAAYEAKGKDVTSTENNPAVTPEFVEKVATVQKLLFEGDRFYETGQFDRATERYSQILALDPYNKTARAKMERVERQRMAAYRAGHKAAKQDALYQVSARWSETPTLAFAKTSSVQQGSGTSNLARLTRKLETIKIPSLTFTNLAIEDAIRFLEAKSRELDPEGEGVNFVLKMQVNDPPPAVAPAAGGGAGAAPAPAPAPMVKTVTLNLSNVSLMEVLRFLTTVTTLKYKIEEYAVFLLPINDSPTVLTTRTFSVPSGFFSGGLRTSAPAAGGFTTAESVQVDVKQELTNMGVEFPAGATAAFLSSTSKLVVKNTPDQMDVIEALLEARRQEAPQVEIETKFVEFTEDALKELAFNWSVSPTTDLIPLPLIGTITSPLTAFLGGNGVGPSATTAVGASPDVATATALRTEQNLRNNSLDALLGLNTTGVNLRTGQPLVQGTPNQLALGMRVDGKGMLFLANMINRIKGADLLSAPKVTTRSKNPAKVEIIRELRYPTSFERPEIPSAQNFQINGAATLVAMPSTPSDFEVKNIGVTLSVTPTAYPDRRIDLDLTPEVVDFEGFIDYGQPIVQGDRLDTDIFVLVNGTVNQPVFNVRSMTTKVQVIDGQTVAMGGLIREDTQKIDDKVPVLGDLPGIGRLFRSKVDQSVKRNLVIFVTARLIKSDGKPLYSQEIVETPTLEATSSIKTEEATSYK